MKINWQHRLCNEMSEKDFQRGGNSVGIVGIVQHFVEVDVSVQHVWTAGQSSLKMQDCAVLSQC